MSFLDSCLDISFSSQEKSRIGTLVRSMAKFPGSTVRQHSVLHLIQGAGLHCFVKSMSCNHIRLPYVPSNDEFVILDTNGSSFRRISNSGITNELSLSRAAEIDAICDSSATNTYSEDALAPDMSVDWIQADGSIAVTSAGVKWTVLGGRDLLQSNYNRFNELLPEIAHKMSRVAILRSISGVLWTPNDASKLICSFSRESNLPRVVEVVPSRVNNEEDHIIPGGKVGKILITAGNIDSSTLFAITTGLAAMPVDGPNKVFFEYPKFVFVVLSYVLMFGSWMLKSTTGRNAITEKRLNSLSYCTAGGAAICAIAGVLCILFTSLSLPYALCGISICFLFVLLCVAYNAYSI